MPGPEPTPPKRSHWIWIAAALAAAVLFVAGVLLVRNAPRLVSMAIHAELAERGLGSASFGVEDVGWGHLRLTDVAIGDPVALRLPEVSVSYSLASLFTGKLDELQVKNLTIHGDLGPNGLSLGALDILFPSPDGPTESIPPAHGEAAAGAPTILIRRIQIDDARIDIQTEDGPVGGELWLSLDDSRHLAFRFQANALDGAKQLTGFAVAPFSIDGEATVDPERRTLRLQPTTLALGPGSANGGEKPRIAIALPTIEAVQEGGLGEDVRIQALGGSVELAEPGIDLEGIDFDLDWNPASTLPKGRVEIKEVRLAGPKPWVSPLSLKAALVPDDQTLAADIDLTDPSRRFVLRIHATQNFRAASGEARIRLAPLEFGEHATELGTLLPGLSRLGIAAAGNLSLRGTARWGARRTKLRLEVGLQNVSVSTASGRVSCLNGVLRIEGPPFGTVGSQEVSMALLDIGLQLRDGLVRYRWLPGGALLIERSEWKVAGGRVFAAGEYDPERAIQTFLLAVEGVQLDEFMSLLPIEGLTGEGALSGRLPLFIREDSVEIRDGILASEGKGGRIRYRPAEGAGQLSGFGISELIDLEAALENFEFTRLELRVDGDARSELTVRVSIAGANPEYRDGQPYVLNLKVEGRLVDLIDSGSAAYSLPQKIEKELIENFGQAEEEAAPLQPCEVSGEPEPLDTPTTSG